MALLMFERVENLAYVTWIRRSNPVHSIRIVNGRFSSRYVVRGLGFCDLNSPDIFRRALSEGHLLFQGSVRVRWVIAELLNNTDAISSPYGHKPVPTLC